VCSSGFRAVVVIADDGHAGHTVGMVTAAVACDRSAPRFQESLKVANLPHASKAFGEGLAGMAQDSEKQEAIL